MPKGKKILHRKEGDVFIGRWSSFGAYILHDFMVKYYGTEFIETQQKRKIQIEARDTLFYLCYTYIKELRDVKKLANFWMVDNILVCKSLQRSNEKIKNNAKYKELCDLIIYKAFFMPKEEYERINS